ncbi:hypothetical protein PISL3812_08884 [Talaromyces islandicus]|uniref:Homeobox domain-containing protein n=1 Tax=Talaromyces islandicus TaxID=28573 RepID=A0A0U1MA42_TALIS|nr:hypothetical protein PISL3812_08884 [Talaromyces islandicus]
MPTLDSSSTAASSSSPPQAYASEPANLNYAFLVHSQKTLTQNLPPRVDNKLLARQKRRRTSPEDHAVLEAEYKKNPKPDKAARASIVSRVALGEKEVQIWFQNRRQNDRRKSKPLEPHELVGPRASGNAADAPPSCQNNTSQLNFSFESDDQERNRDEHAKVDADDSEIVAGVCNSSSDVELPSSQLNGEIPSSQTTHPLSETPNQEKFMDNPEEIAGLGINGMSRKRAFSEVDAMQPPADAQSTQVEFRSPPSLRISMSFDGEALVRQTGEPTPSPPKPRASLRISMSSDGEALIRTEDEPSPSKNRMRMVPSRTRRQSGLRRSTSAIVFGALRPAMADREGEPRPFGRSRDARMWELYCDTDARSALSTPASSQGMNGARTPGLYRSGSHRSLARTSSISRSTFSARPELDSCRAADEFRGEKRRKLARTVSSLGRLESVQRAGLADWYSGKTPQATGKPSKDQGKELEQDAGDSDKENWLPGTQERAAPRRHRRVASHAPRAVLKENGLRKNTAIDDLALAAGSTKSRVSRGLRGSNKENEVLHPGKIDSEVAAFMSKTRSSSRAEDLDCIQGLLSLSQGAWR